MNKFIELIESFIDQKISFKDFDKKWFELHHISGIYDDLQDNEKDFLDEINDKEDYALKNEKELEDLRKYNFTSVEEFRSWLKEYLVKNEEIIKKYSE